jgi:hypothetical protein
LYAKNFFFVYFYYRFCQDLLKKYFLCSKYFCSLSLRMPTYCKKFWTFSPEIEINKQRTCFIKKFFFISFLYFWYHQRWNEKYMIHLKADNFHTYFVLFGFLMIRKIFIRVTRNLFLIFPILNLFLLSVLIIF